MIDPYERDGLASISGVSAYQPGEHLSVGCAELVDIGPCRVDRKLPQQPVSFVGGDLRQCLPPIESVRIDPSF
jgi:hypothetical protein